MYNDFPWPIKDRDHVSKLTFLKLKDNSVKVKINSSPESYPKQLGAIRLTNFEGFWLFENQDNGVKVTQQMFGDPRGAIPSFVVNATLVNAPFYTLQKLKSRLEN